MVSSADVEANLDMAASLISEASGNDIQLAVLPEYFPVIGNDETEKLKYQETFRNGPLQDFLADNAGKNGIWLMGGSIPLATDNMERVSNSCLLFSPQGNCTARYDKIHLFDVYVGDEQESYNESNTMVAGNSVTVAETPFGNIGMSICYDLRFPEHYRKMLKHGVDIITVPSAFTEATGRRHWELLLRARAVENLCYVIAPNQGGKHSEKRRTWGHSMVVDPWGEVLSSMEFGNGVVYAELDLARQQELRKSFPALQHTHLLD